MGIMIEESAEFLNASFPIEVTESGIVIDASLMHQLNASFPIEVTESGMVIDVSSTQP